jgi:tetratricopeptide (TPR) repeat protein
MNPIIKNLYTREELQQKISEYIQDYEDYKSKNYYRLMVFVYSDIAHFYELLGNKKKRNLYYEKIIDIWHDHPGKFVDLECVSALSALQRSEEALQIVLSNPKGWGVETLAQLYEEVGRKKEAIVIYSSLAIYSSRFSEAYYPFWQPHYLQEASDIWTRIESPDYVLKYNQKAVAAWEEVAAWEDLKDNIQKSLSLIEEAWLYEEVGYIYEKAGKFETAMNYYQKAQFRYQKAYTKEPTAVGAHQIDGDWNRYFEFFIYQIPDFGFIHFRCEHPEDNDYRRIKYRILNLKEQMNKV